MLGFAPLTHPRPLAEFQNDYSAHFENSALTSLVDHLTDKHLRFYIGNHDQRVGTDSCYQFIHHLTEKCVEKGIRSPPTELIIYPSIGHKGHGTPPHIFQSGAEWLAQRLYHS